MKEGVTMRRFGTASICGLLCLALGAIPTAGQEASQLPDAPDGPSATASIGFSNFVSGYPFFGDIERGAAEVAEASGVELVAVDSFGDPARQAQGVADLIAQGVDAIVIVPIDPDAIVPSIEAANEAGIPVLAVDRGIAGGELSSLIASDNLAAGRTAGEALFDFMGGSGRVLEVRGDMAVSSGRDRSVGFGEALDAAPDITLALQAPADYDYALAFRATTQALDEDPAITGVFTSNLDMLEGVAAAVSLADTQEQISVVGFDTSPSILMAIEDGLIDATIAQQPRLMGQRAMEAAIAVAAGEPVEAFPVETMLVTAENLDDYRAME
jgi:ABC-type sugar transport system substrate-binding protein